MASLRAASLASQTIPSLFSEPGSVPQAPGKFPPDWVQKTIFYQVFLDRFANGDPGNDPDGTAPWHESPTRYNFFGGDLQGLQDRLDYLAGIGVGAVYLNPIFFAPSNHKYDTQDYLLIDPHFGDLGAFRRLLDAAHKHGIRILLDGVFNHTGDRFWAFRHVLKDGPRSPYAGWYHCHEFPLRQHPEPNYESWWGFASLPKLNIEHPEVIAYLTRVVTFWTSLGIDGWRLDVPNELPDFFWRYFRHLVREINPRAYLVGEIWDDASHWLQGDMFDAVMNYGWRDLVTSFVAEGRIGLYEFERGLAALRECYPWPVTLSMFNLIGSHDTARFLTVAGGDKRRLRLAALLQYSYPGVPVVYYGDEVGLTGGSDPDCRRTMPWRTEDRDHELVGFYRRLGGLRNSSSALQSGGFRVIHQDNEAWTWAYMREVAGERIAAVFNFSTTERFIRLETGCEGEWEDLLGGGSCAANPCLNLPALCGTILRQR